MRVQTGAYFSADDKEFKEIREFRESANLSVDDREFREVKEFREFEEGADVLP